MKLGKKWNYTKVITMKLKVIKNKKDAEEFLKTSLTEIFSKTNVRKFGNPSFYFSKGNSLHSSFLPNCIEPFDFSIIIRGQKTHTNLFSDAINIIFENRSEINKRIKTY